MTIQRLCVLALAATMTTGSCCCRRRKGPWCRRPLAGLLCVGFWVTLTISAGHLRNRLLKINVGDPNADLADLPRQMTEELPIQTAQEEKKPPLKAIPMKTSSSTASRFKPILPNILIIGAQKAGSTALSDWLFSRGVCGGQIVAGEPSFYHKEMHFFDRDERYAKGKDFYKRRYGHCVNRKNRLRLDATPTTMQHPERVLETYQKVRNISKLRIVVSLREPIARELSMYNHQLSQYNKNPNMTEWYGNVVHPNGTAKTFEEFVDTVTIPSLENPLSPSALAHYAHYLHRWYDLFEAQQILVLSYQEDIRRTNRAKLLLQKFIGYPFPVTGPFPVTNTHASDSKVKTMPCRVRDKLQVIFEPWNQELYALLYNQSMTLPETDRPRPFPEFTLPACVNDNGELVKATSTV